MFDFQSTKQYMILLLHLVQHNSYIILNSDYLAKALFNIKLYNINKLFEDN